MVDQIVMMVDARISPLCCFAIISSALFTISQCTIYVGASEEIQSDSMPSMTFDNDNAAFINHEMNGKLSAKWVDELIHSTESFLAREDTPVWIAYYLNSIENVNYKKLEKNRVKKAVDYWNSERFVDLPTVEKSKRDNVHYEPWSLFSEKTFERDRIVISNDRKKARKSEGDESSMKVAHLSILIMMDYVENWPTDKMSQEKLINERILYAIGFWNAVDIQLREIENPNVRLRISGIIIGAHPRATPYVYENRKGKRLKMDEAYASMLEYWIDQAESQENFPLTAYHAVVTMTNSTPAGFGYPYAASSLGPPCEPSEEVTMSSTQRKRMNHAYEGGPPEYKLPNADIGGIIFSDDLAFSGIQVAVRETAHTLGASMSGPILWSDSDKNRYVMSRDVGMIGRKWALESLQEISDRIRSNGRCLEEPREFEQSGNPIELILPGLLVPASNQCKAQRFSDGEVCWHRSSCRNLYCKKHLACWHWCSDSGPPLEGTISITEKMCLDEEHIDNSTIIDGAITRQKIHWKTNI